MEEITLRMTFRTVLSMMDKSAMLAASVKSSSMDGGLMKATCAAPIYAGQYGQSSVKSRYSPKA